MKQKHEVEYRALLDREIFQTLMEHGKKKFQESFKGHITIQDTYFCLRSVKDFQEVEMNNVGSYSLRLRKETNGNKTSITLNTKTIQNAGDHNAWLEHEVSVSSYEECRSILETIGFKAFFDLKKRRYSFQDGEIQVCLEDIENFQPAIEIEILTSADKTEEAKKKLLNYFHKHHINNENVVKKSITNILMRERASF